MVNNHVGEKFAYPSVIQDENPWQAADGQWENGLAYGESASGHKVWTKFDPLGLSNSKPNETAVNAAGGDLSAEEMEAYGIQGPGEQLPMGGGGVGGAGGGGAASSRAPTKLPAVIDVPQQPKAPVPMSAAPASPQSAAPLPEDATTVPASPKPEPVSPPSAPAANAPVASPKVSTEPSTTATGGQGPEAIETPYGPAEQSSTPEAQAALKQVKAGATVYRQGVFGKQNTTGAQFWSLKNPATTPSFPLRLGMPGGDAKPDWIMGGTVAPESPVITRPAPGIAPNPGGDIEAVTPPDGVKDLWFHMPD